MLKRIVLALALMLCAASFTVEAAPWGSKSTTATKTKIDQSSKQALMKTFIQAMFINQDYDAMWQLFSPELKKEMIKEVGSEKAAKEAFTKEIKKGMAEMDKDELAIVKGAVSTPEGMNAMIKELLKDGEKDLKKIGNKWYINKLD